MRPQTEAHAFIIWAFCSPLEWNCSVNDISEGTGLSAQVVSATLQAKSWMHRVRVSQRLIRAQSQIDGRYPDSSYDFAGLLTGK
jgi:hypothetical protein